MTAGVNKAMVADLHATGMETGAVTWVSVDGADKFVPGQKIDFGGENGVTYEKKAADGKVSQSKLAGTFLVQAVDAANGKVELMDVVDRAPVKSQGTFDVAKAEVSTYKLVGPQYFNFFAGVMAAIGVIYIFFAMLYKEKTHVREEGSAAA
jgi:POT family proton-dependent oligopeptide transporter